MIFPTVGYLMASLSLAGISWSKWLRWVMPFIIMEMIVAIIFLVIAQMIQYGPF